MAELLKSEVLGRGRMEQKIVDNRKKKKRGDEKIST
ncbi:hypothetical protein PI124_g24706 [Phytophthora idaei]|nr:hypothetical protein PI126_g23223 [Phytophthora idaei]KAG3230194.1 hypothetical protein PI124_g24706 [Phytophthora idaei]